MTVNERVSDVLKAKKATQRDLAAAISVSTSTLNNWLKLGRDIPAQYIIPICEFFDVSLSYLLTGKEAGPVIKKSPAPGISENGREMLELYEKLPEREQILLIGRLQEMTAPLLGEVKKGGTAEAGSSGGRAV